MFRYPTHDLEMGISAGSRHGIREIVNSVENILDEILDFIENFAQNITHVWRSFLLPFLFLHSVFVFCLFNGNAQVTHHSNNTLKQN